jgi:hypothetical protein
MRRYSSARRFFAARLFAVAGMCFLAGFPPVQLCAGQPDTPSESRHYFRRYQASAYITLLSINIFSRSDVGFGYAKADEEIYPLERKLSLQFLSGSIAERAHGLNRFGFIQENIQEHNSLCSQADYFGLITANGEESLSQAKAALENTSQTTSFVAAQATIDPQIARYSVRHLALSSNYRGADATELLEQVRASFDHPEAGQQEHVQSLSGDATGTFLYSLREAMRSNSAKLQKRLIYNGKTFRMTVDKREDKKVGEELRAAELIDSASSAILLVGSVQNEHTKELTNFRLWFDRTTPDLLPLRFEFRPKSYLRLVFQAVPATPIPLNRIAAAPAAAPVP